VLNEDGQYRLYDLGGTFHSFSLGTEAAETGVVEARIMDSGLVALTGNLSFLEVKGWTGSKASALSIPSEWLESSFDFGRWLTKRHQLIAMTSPPITWTVLPPDQTSSRHAEVVMAVEGTIYTCDNLEHIDQVRPLS
jgi:vacuolar protein sorting-associated protein 16